MLFDFFLKGILRWRRCTGHVGLAVQVPGDHRGVGPRDQPAHTADQKAQAADQARHPAHHEGDQVGRQVVADQPKISPKRKAAPRSSVAAYVAVAAGSTREMQWPTGS